MRIVSFKCQKCGEKKTTTDDSKSYSEKICIACRGKQGLLNQASEELRLELERLLEGKELSKDQEKGMLMEMAVSMTLDDLAIPHQHNPFNNTYVCYQGRRPDIIIEKLNTIIECKNLNKTQVYHLSRNWLNKNVIDRPYTTAYKHRIVIFSYKPRPQLVQHLKTNGWKAFSLGYQITNSREARKATPRLRQRLDWARNLGTQEVLTHYVPKD